MSLLESIQNDEQSFKLTEAEQSGVRKAGTYTLNAALLYQQSKLYNCAKYGYSRALLTYYLAGELAEEDEGMQHYLEVRTNKAVYICPL
jgi:hypothetical protein